MLRIDLLAVVILIIAIVLEIKNIKRGKDTVFKGAVKLLFLLYVLLLIKVVFFPIPATREAIGFLRERGIEEIRNLIPFEMIFRFLKYSSFSNALKQIGGNLILLFPLGAFVTVFTKIKSKKVKFLIGLGTTVFIELTQGLIGILIGFQYRVVDVDDIILNTIGYAIGMVVGEKLVRPIVRKYLNNRKNR